MSESKPTRATRLHGDLDENFQEYRDERGMTTSEALRTLVRKKLVYEQGNNESSADLASQHKLPTVTMVVSHVAMASLHFSTITLLIFAVASQTALVAAIAGVCVLWLVVSSSLLLTGGARRLDEYLEKRSLP